MSDFLCDMRGDAGSAQVGDQLGCIELLVSSERQAPGRSWGVAVDHVEGGAPFGMAVCLRQVTLHDQARAVLHQRMTHEAQHRAGAGGHLVKPRVRVGGRGMRGIGPLLAPEVDFGIAVLTVRAGHRVGLGRVGLILGGGVRSGWAARVVIGRRVISLRLEAFHRGPGLDQRAVDREVVVRQKRRDLAMRQDRRHHLARHLRRQKPVAVLGEDRRHPDRIVDPETDEPAEQEVILHLFYQLPLGADRKHDLDQAGPDQPLRRDRGAAEIGVSVSNSVSRLASASFTTCRILRNGCRAGIRASRST